MHHIESRRDESCVPSSLIIDSERYYNAMRVMSTTTAIPNLQWISLRHLKGRHCGSDVFEVYARELQSEERCVFHPFRGYYLSPPNAEDFRRLCEDD